MNESTYAAMRAYIDVAVELQVEKRLQEARAAAPVETREVIAGPPGKDGRDGKDGVDGKDGHDGKDGERGEPGVRGADGLAGRDGAPSLVPGPRGERGERGADGIATRAELDALIEERFASIETRFAGLTTRSLADVYREVWREGETYERGDLAQWDGSPWLAMARTTSRPGTSPDWKLFAKKGRDGRDRK